MANTEIFALDMVKDSELFTNIMQPEQKVNSIVLKYSFTFASIASVLLLNCSMSDTINSGEMASRSKIKITHGTSSTIELPSGNTSSDTIDVVFDSDSGVTYTVILELPNSTWFASNWDLQFSDSILWSRENQTNTLLIPCEKTGTIQLPVYGPPKSKFKISVNNNQTIAWWRPKPDNWDNFQTNTDSFRLARRLSFNERLGDSIDDRFWQIGSLTPLPWKLGQTVQSIDDSGALRKNWFSFTSNSTRNYTVLLQALEKATPDLIAFDSLGKTVGFENKRADCDNYNVCISKFEISVMKNSTTYFRISQYRKSGYRVMVSN